MKPPSVGRSVIGSYSRAEEELDRILQIVPYCEDHEDVWSPSLVPILLDVSSQIDSLWKFEASQSKYVTKHKLDVADYFEFFGKIVASRWLVFWGERAFRMEPFKEWQRATAYKRENHIPLEWWKAHLDLKHDRIRNQRKATLQHAVTALAALFLAVLRLEHCRSEIAQVQWLTSGRIPDDEAHAWLGEDTASTKDQFICAETKLFSYPVGWAEIDVKAGTDWPGSASPRFIEWFKKYSTA